MSGAERSSERTQRFPHLCVTCGLPDQGILEDIDLLASLDVLVNELQSLPCGNRVAQGRLLADLLEALRWHAAANGGRLMQTVSGLVLEMVHARLDQDPHRWGHGQFGLGILRRYMSREFFQKEWISLRSFEDRLDGASRSFSGGKGRVEKNEALLASKRRKSHLGHVRFRDPGWPMLWPIGRQ